MHVSFKNGFAITQNFKLYYIIFTISSLDNLIYLDELKTIRESMLICLIQYLKADFLLENQPQSSEFMNNLETFCPCHYILPHQHVQPVYV